ncbi:MAG: right-handed parallel beta-helix repeat-containing protein [Chitinophagaceae bacterium]
MTRLLTGLMLLLSVTTQANNYYFSSVTGDDSRSSLEAQNPATPWKTLAKLTSFFPSLQPGDSVLLKRDETFYGTIISGASGTAANPIVIASFGAGAKPIISGFSILNNWVAAGNNTWETTNPSLNDSVNVLLLNGASQFRGRYPNADAPNGGYLFYESHAGNFLVTDNELGSSQDWSGADIVIRKNRYITDRGKIIQQTGNSLFYTGTSSYEAVDSFGYFIQNHPATLDQRGEWCYNGISKKMTLYLNAGENPNGQEIKASLYNTLLQVWNKRYIYFNDLDFTGANEYAIDIFGNTNIQFNRCHINNAGTTAVIGLSNTSILLDSCQILHSNNNGIYLQDENNTTIRNCIIKNTGEFPGMGNNGENTYQAINITGSNNIIQNNFIDSTGYTAVRFEGDFVEVKNNLVQHFNFVKDDGAGIYTWTGSPAVVYRGRKITDNIVLYGAGAGYGTPEPDAQVSYGIYLDETAGYVDIQGNTAAYCKGAGLFLHNANNINVSNNTLFNNGTQMLLNENHTYLLRANSIFGNMLFSKYNYQPVSHLLADLNDFTEFGTFDNNYYCRPIDDKFVFETDYKVLGELGHAVYDLPGWQNKFGFDLNSKITGTQIPPYAITSLSASNKFANGGFNSNLDSALTFSSIGICHGAWVNGEALDGGAMKVYFDGPNDSVTNNKVAYVIMHVGSVDTTKQYVLRFSLQGTKNLKTFQVYLRKEGEPYNPLVNPQYCNVSTTRTENEFQFSFPQSQSSASIIFEISKDVGDFYIDNIRLSEAVISPTNADDYIRFEYNATANSSSVDLNGIEYVDAKNNPFSGTLTLAPWSSIVLIRKALDVLPVKFSQFSGKLIQKEVQLNWSTTPPPDGSRFEIERSPDQHFIKIGTIDATMNVSPGMYRFTDPLPEPGKNYYRIKEIDADGAFTYSNVIVININTTEKAILWPNPATGSIHLNLPKSLIGKKLALSLQTVTGTILATKQLIASGETISFDISAYSKGLYLLRIDENGEFNTINFIKQ